jgi:PAS domain S-box-containing protein
VAIEPVLSRDLDLLSQLLAAHDALGVGLVITEQGRIIHANEAFCRLSGYPLDELKALPNGLSLVHPATRALAAQYQVERHQAPISGHMDLLLSHRDGTQIDVEVGVHPLATPTQVRSLIMVRDIRDRRRAEERAVQFAQRLASAEPIADLGSWENDLVTGTVTWSDHLFRIYGFEPGEFTPTFPALLELIHPEDREGFLDWLERTRFDATFSGERRIVRKDGTIRHILTKGCNYFDPDGKPTKIVGVSMDITERKEADELRNDFLASVSHEMRTPLTSIQFALELLAADMEQSDRHHKFLAIANRNTDQLIRLVNDILDAERLESGRIQMVMCPSNLGAIVRQVAETFEPEAGLANVRIEVEAEPLEVSADATRLFQVFSNLLSNALRFSPPDSRIEIAVKPYAHGALATVRDHGRGIPPDQLELIFDRFRQVHTSDFHEKRGVGLGLAICRSIVQRHGGRIWAESTWGKGSTFHIFLPWEQKKGKEITP